MEIRIRPSASSRRARRKRIAALGLGSLALVAVLALWGGEAGRRVSGAVSSRLSGMMRLEAVAWEESGAGNLSGRVNGELLWKASGLNLGQEMLTLDLAALEKRILAVPWIESAQIQKRLPSMLSVRYTVHHARALGVRGGRPWLVSSAGKWIVAGAQGMDLPVLSADADAPNIEGLFPWLDALEVDLGVEVFRVHEITQKRGRISALIELRYPSQVIKISVILSARPARESLIRLKRVVQYLIKNNILVSAIDVRIGKKVVVNVGKHP